MVIQSPVRVAIFLCFIQLARSQNLDLYKCHPDCAANECCLHIWNDFGKREVLREVFGLRHRRVTNYCAPLLVENDVCLVQHAVEQCPCGHGLICVPDQGEFHNYYGHCRPGR
ncbi:uncharacterized protein LOC111110607 [Crassostrea virginica]|uniref:Uncharacterized protein LOC111110607 n=1 Tax=Crassostrea virginica TaxID=6565 RepID=A0A8B8BHN0_CRAVI|nr:uncharacterized protein LOC111110607 [Crassostrea virginica]